MSRVADLLEAIRARLAAARTVGDGPVFADVRTHLDPYTLDDLMRESIQPPAARVVLVDVKPEPNAIGSLSLVCRIAIVVVTAREGRYDERIPSADLAALELAILAGTLVHRDPYFGLGKIGAAQVREIGVTVSERAKGNARGVAIAATNLTSTLLDVIPEPALVSEAATIGREPWPPVTGLMINGVEVPADETGIPAPPTPPAPPIHPADPEGGDMPAAWSSSDDW